MFYLLPINARQISPRDAHGNAAQSPVAGITAGAENAKSRAAMA
jgi:hypothetical protein